MIVKKGQSNVEVKRASEYLDTENESESPRKNEKLVNVIYNDGQYHIYEPQNKG